MWRVLNAGTDLVQEPPKEAERLFVLFLILHLSASFEARKHGMYFSEGGLEHDIRDFFILPIPRQVWRQFRGYQEPDFVRFVESIMGAATEPIDTSNSS